MSSTSARTQQVIRRRPMFAMIAAAIGFVLAVGWFFAARTMTRTRQHEQQAKALTRAGELIELLRQGAQDRVKGDVQMLAEDPRLKSTLSAANVDEATILDVLQDLQKLNGQPVFAVLDPDGRVKAVLGAPKLKGLDLSTSSVVKAAAAQEGAAVGVWLVEDRVAEIAVSAVRIGDRVVALLVVGNLVTDAALTKAAQTAGVHLGLMIDDKLIWSDGDAPAAGWSGDVTRIDVKGATPPARFMATGVELDEPTWQLAFAVPLLALVFAVLAFWRGGAR